MFDARDSFGIRIGEAFAGEGVNAAHINVVVGDRAVLGAAFASALARPVPGHVPFVAVIRPGVPTKPVTLFVNKATIEGERHGNLTWGAAQAGVALGMARAVERGDVPAAIAEQLVAIAAVWVNPEADDDTAVFRNNLTSMVGAVRGAVTGRPDVHDVAAATSECHNPYFDARGLLDP